METKDSRETTVESYPTFRVNNDAGYKLVEVTYFPLWRGNVTVNVGDGGCLLTRKQAADLGRWLLARAEDGDV